MATRLIPFELHNTDGTLTDAEQVRLDTTNFDGTGNLNNTDDDLQTLAETVNGLTIDGGGTTLQVPVIEGFRIDIDQRINLNTNLQNSTAVRYTIRNHGSFTSFKLFVNDTELYTLNNPTSDGASTTLIPSTAFASITTDTKKKLVFRLEANDRYMSNTDIVQVDTIEATEVVVDRTNLSANQATTAQGNAEELERLFGVVSRIQADASPSARPIIIFNDGVTITSANITTYADKNAIYSAARDKRVTFLLPLDTEITDYPAVFEITHLGGTARFDSGSAPTNTVVIDTKTADTTSIETATGQTLSSVSLFRGDIAVLIKTASGQNWIAQEGSFDPRSSLLGNNLFSFNTRTVRLLTNSGGTAYVSDLLNYTPSQGDAFVVTGAGITTSSSFEREILANDVLVALVDDPDILLTNTNEDWLIIRNAGHNDLSLTELRFLSQITELDNPINTRLADAGVADALVWLADSEFVTAPFLTPSADSNNPRPTHTNAYVGGREDVNADEDFILGENYFNAFMYIGITPTFITSNGIANIYVQLFDIDGNFIHEYSLNDNFIKPAFNDNATVAYYGLSVDKQANIFSSINYTSGTIIKLVVRTQDRHFRFDSSSIDATQNINNLQEAQLSQIIQAKLNKPNSLTPSDRVKLNAINTTTETPITIGTNFTFKYKFGSPSHIDSDYRELNNSDGLFQSYTSTTPYTVRVEGNANITNASIFGGSTVAVTEVVPSLFTGERMYTLTLPQAPANVNYDVTVHPASLVGTITNEIASGMDSTWKVEENNISQNLHDRLFNSRGSYNLPTNLQQFSDNLDVIPVASTTWSTISPEPISSTLTRQFALLWDENRRTSTDNYFDDLTGLNITGFTDADVRYYADPNDPLNTQFKGAGSYIINDNIRVRNTTGTTPVTTASSKIIAFDYVLQSELSDSDNINLLRVGDASTPTLLGIDKANGLYINVGTGDSTQRSRTYTKDLTATISQWVASTFVPTTGESSITLPVTGTGAVEVVVTIDLDNAGESGGTATNTFNITALETNQSFGNTTFTFTDNPNLVVDVRYEFNSSSSTHTLYLNPVTAITGVDLTYSIGAYYRITENWNISTTYTRQSITAGIGVEDYGIYDPARYNSDLLKRNRVFLLVEPYRENDSDSDPEIALKVIVNGEHEGTEAQEYKIRLHRPQSAFNFSDMSFGGSFTAISRIQVYDYTSTAVPTEADLIKLYNRANSWVGGFNPSTASSLLFDVHNLSGDNNPAGESFLPEPLKALNNQASVFNITHTDFTNKYIHTGIGTTFVFLKNKPDADDTGVSYPITAAQFVNEINNSLVTVTPPSNLNTVHLKNTNTLSTLTQGVMEGAGIFYDTAGADSFVINSQDPNNFRLVIGVWFRPHSTGQAHLIHALEHGSTTRYLPLVDVEQGNIDITRVTAGTASSRTVTHTLYTTDGEYSGIFQGDTTQTKQFNVYNTRTYTIRAGLISGGTEISNTSFTVAINSLSTAITSTAQTLTFSTPQGNHTQDLTYTFTPSTNTYAGHPALFSVQMTGLNTNPNITIDSININVQYDTTESFTVPSETQKVSQSDGNIVLNKLHKVIFSFRNVASGDNPNHLECIYTLYGYDSQGNPRIFDENTLGFNESAFNYDWSNIRIGGDISIQNIQGFYINPDTPLFDYPLHSTLRNWLTSHDNKVNDYIWDNVQAPNQDVEAVYFPEYVTFENLVFVDRADGKRKRIFLNNGSIESEEVT